MKVIIILGSRNPDGQTAEAIKSLESGLKERDVNIDKYFLPQNDIKLCQQCYDDGWGLCRKENKCIIDDDFREIVNNLLAADLAVMANPVYFGGLSESMQSFLGRLRRIRHQGGLGEIADLPAIGICVAGGSGRGTTSSIDQLNDILRICGFDVLDMIAARRQNLELKVETLKTTGKWLGENLYRFRTFD